MNTFLPFPDFAASAVALDRARLGKQRLEVAQLIRALLGQTAGWANHPAAVMWRGHIGALARYGLAVCDAWTARGYRDNQRPLFEAYASDGPAPWWVGDHGHHARHRAALLAKAPEWYQQYGWSETPELCTVWPTNQPGQWVQIANGKRRVLSAA